MLRVIQSWTGKACLLCLLCASGASGAPTVVQPVIDRPGACAYCDVVEIAFSEAVESIDLLLGNAQLEGNPLLAPLIAAHERGVRVRVLLDESDWAASITEKNRPTLDYLVDCGIEAAFDDPSVTTHAKLVIVDRTVVILGSTNWNRYAFTDQEQANVRIVDDRVAGAFAEWFDRLWTEEDAETVRVAVDAARPAADGPLIVALPDGDGSTTYASSVLSWMSGARESIHVALYRMSVYTSYADSVANKLLDAMVRAAGRGVDVRVLIDDCSFYAESAEANLSSALFLFEHGIPVRFDRPEETMHAKLLIIDGEHVILGSTNWNYYALERNVEANVALVGMPEVAGVFDEYFETLWREGRAIGP